MDPLRLTEFAQTGGEARDAPCAVAIDAPTRSGSHPISSPASLSAIRAAATANFANRSILRILFRWSHRFGSKSLASQAIRTEWPEAAKAVIGPPPPSPAKSRRQVVSMSGPSGVTAPKPVTTALRSALMEAAAVDLDSPQGLASREESPTALVALAELLDSAGRLS